MVPYGRQSISEDDIQAVCSALRSDFLTTGPLVQRFEQKFAEAVGAKHAVAVCNATAALHLAMLACEIGPGDRVVTSPITFVASANCAAYVGATPDFADIDCVSYCLCPNSLDENWRSDTRAIVAVDYAGQTADMPAIADVARRRGALVIEDASHAVGGRFEHQGRIWPIGGHPWADVTVFSFHPVKTMTTGEGGMLVTDNADIATRARAFRTHGIVRDPALFTGLQLSHNDDERGPWHHEMHHLGYNYRITDFQCALGINQLARLSEMLGRRREIVRSYNLRLPNTAWLQKPELRNVNDESTLSWHLYTIQLDFESLGSSRTEVMQSLAARGIGTQVLYIPVYLQPWYRRTLGYTQGKCPNAESFYRRTLSLPLFPAMTDDDVSAVIDSVSMLARSVQ